MPAETVTNHQIHGATLRLKRGGQSEKTSAGRRIGHPVNEERNERTVRDNLVSRIVLEIGDPTTLAGRYRHSATSVLGHSIRANHSHPQFTVFAKRCPTTPRPKC